MSLKYFIPVLTVARGSRWGKQFRMLDNNKERLYIEEYSVTMTNMIDVFELLTKPQIDLKPRR